MKKFLLLSFLFLTFTVEAALVVTSPVTSPVESVTGDSEGSFLPSDLANLATWYRFNTGITVTGAGVSNWADQSGNGRDLLQGTDANRPLKESDGSISFDGIDNYLKAVAFTLNQPETIYILFQQFTWTALDTIFDGNTADSGELRQRFGGASPQLEVFAGSLSAANSDLPLTTYGVAAIVFNGASSSFQINNNTPLTGNYGASNMGGFTLGRYGGATRFSNIEVKEVIIYSVAHDASTRTKVINYLNAL